MKNIALINMAFGTIQLPSLGLTQIKDVVNRQFPGQFSAKIYYLNHDFAKYLGNEMIYSYVLSVEGLVAGLGDWFFRQAAFPNVPDNAELYSLRYFRNPSANIRALVYYFLEKRKGLRQFIDNIIDKYALDKADIVGFTSLFSQNLGSIALAGRLKERNKNLVTVMGGPSCEGSMGYEIVKNVDCIDYVFSGPALVSFPQFIRCLAENRMDLCHSIDGVFSKSNSTRSYLEQEKDAHASTIVGDHGEELHIDTDIELDYDDYFASIETHFSIAQIKPALLFDLSRGCWWGERCQCSFCGLNGSKMHYAAMSPENALKRVKSLFKYAPKTIQLKCTDNIIPRSFINEVLPQLDTPQNLGFFFEVRVDLSDSEMEKMARKGIKSVQAGIESLAGSTLKLIRKGSTAFQNIMFLKNARKYGIETSWNLLIGFPGEEESVYEKYIHDIPLLTHLIPPGNLSPVRFDRYSTYFYNARQYKLELKPYDFYELVYPFSKKSLSRLAYYFMDFKSDSGYISILNRWQPRIAAKWNQWINLWKLNPKPGLYFKNNGNTIFDSRSGRTVEHNLSEIEKAAIALLEKPRVLKGLVESLPSFPETEVKRGLDLLQQKGLLFHERGSFLSLVVKK